MITAVTIAKFTSSKMTQFRHAIAEVVAEPARVQFFIVRKTVSTEITITEFTDTVRCHAVCATGTQYGVILFIDAPECFLIEKRHSIDDLVAVVTGKRFITFR